MHITYEVTMGTIINLVITLGVGAFLVLLRYTLKREKELLISKEEHLTNAHKGFLTEIGHDDQCKETIKEVIFSRKTEIKEAMDMHSKILDEKFIVLNKNIELAVIRGINNANGR